MTEEEVRKAFKVALSCANNCSNEYHRDAFNAVFQAMIYGPVQQTEAGRLKISDTPHIDYVKRQALESVVIIQAFEAVQSRNGERILPTVEAFTPLVDAVDALLSYRGEK